ncbi:MAG: hypothetical protein E6700_10390 [Winkia neuii]|uniref:Uncharacterized protein n=1 Tax=Winkia neuii TaxID=33007 RepID=A0A2I1IN83_9ACTO|nr:hypothetical protein [Winkia neuii]OFK01852.1 hypothetical protein HMPREF2835_08730 [Actinomyces sp. HMSC072A03]OFT57139.1 hypothetical protein HMPREF3152_00010 [Actinomyces sp. HMSC06A08]KWZ73923.1 hypothetical protein HMPREF3198_01115 [Winkia neuii]MDK8100725.1 hypothetical protein [Winkia neuii]MDU3135953.1 hypothetical protein [Winkia neuii]
MVKIFTGDDKFVADVQAIADLLARSPRLGEPEGDDLIGAGFDLFGQNSYGYMFVECAQGADQTIEAMPEILQVAVARAKESGIAGWIFTLLWDACGRLQQLSKADSEQEQVRELIDHVDNTCRMGAHLLLKYSQDDDQLWFPAMQLLSGQYLEFLDMMMPNMGVSFDQQTVDRLTKISEERRFQKIAENSGLATGERVSTKESSGSASGDKQLKLDAIQSGEAKMDIPDSVPLHHESVQYAFTLAKVIRAYQYRAKQKFGVSDDETGQIPAPEFPWDGAEFVHAKAIGVAGSRTNVPMLEASFEEGGSQDDFGAAMENLLTMQKVAMAGGILSIPHLTMQNFESAGTQHMSDWEPEERFAWYQMYQKLAADMALVILANVVDKEFACNLARALITGSNKEYAKLILPFYEDA